MHQSDGTSSVFATLANTVSFDLAPPYPRINGRAGGSSSSLPVSTFLSIINTSILCLETSGRILDPMIAHTTKSPSVGRHTLVLLSQAMGLANLAVLHKVQAWALVLTMPEAVQGCVEYRLGAETQPPQSPKTLCRRRIQKLSRRASPNKWSLINLLLMALGSAEGQTIWVLQLRMRRTTWILSMQ